MGDEKKFKEGDVVMVKSGGLPMTVDSYLEDGGVKCVWFDEKNNHKFAAFKEDTLELVEEDDGYSPIRTG